MVLYDTMAACFEVDSPKRLASYLTEHLFFATDFHFGW